MEQQVHRFRNNAKAIAIGNPGWEQAREHNLIDLRVRVAGNDRLEVEGTGFQFVNLSSCSYLGLHDYPAILEGAIEALRSAKTMDVPITRVRIRLNLVDELEARLSDLFRAPCISSVTASAATTGVLPLIASGHLSGGQPPLMIFDKFCHFSMNLIKPICADETQVVTAPHNDLNFVEDACKKHPQVAYVADGAYSMGGAAPVRELMELQDRYGLFIFLDDSHSLSVYGERGVGYARSLMGDEMPPRTIIVGSLCKGFGAAGGVIMMGPETAAHHDLIIRFGGPLAWSQHLNSAGMGAGLASVRIHESPELPRLQGKLRENLALFDSLIGTEQSGDDFSIRMVVIGSEAAAADASGKIFERGFYTSPVFFPIVERGKAGLRVMLRADNRPEDIRTFCELVRDAVELD